MNPWLMNPTFVAYAISSLALVANLMILWTYSAAVRAKTKTAINKEDAERFGAIHNELDPPEVARVLRAHTNAQATIYPFLFLGLIFVMIGGPALLGEILFGIFVLARVLHSVVYLKAQQPWRTIFFSISGLVIAVLFGEIIWLMIKGCSCH